MKLHGCQQRKGARRDRSDSWEGAWCRRCKQGKITSILGGYEERLTTQSPTASHRSNPGDLKGSGHPCAANQDPETTFERSAPTDDHGPHRRNPHYQCREIDAQENPLTSTSPIRGTSSTASTVPHHTHFYISRHLLQPADIRVFPSDLKETHSVLVADSVAFQRELPRKVSWTPRPPSRPMARESSRSTARCSDVPSPPPVRLIYLICEAPSAPRLFNIG